MAAPPCCQSFQKWLSLMLYVSGIVLSSYAYYVEGSKSADENYVALCDINENVTCSKVFNSKYGKGMYR
jgi:vitamin-K-epoxide reductase (warfarin-sensitive)